MLAGLALAARLEGLTEKAPLFLQQELEFWGSPRMQ